MPTNPVDAGRKNEAAIEDALLARMRGVRRLDESLFFDGIRQGGRYGGVTQSEQWGAGLDEALRKMRAAEVALLRRGWLQGVSEIPGGSELRGEADAFAQRWADQRARTFLAEFEQATRDNIRRMVRNAGARYNRAPDLTEAQRMAEDVKRRLGVTGPQARQLEAYVREARRAGVPESVIDREVTRRAQTAIAARARFAAEREAVEAMNFGRAAAWAEARRRGLVGPLEKRWRDVGDSRVRASHHAQTLVGWIPWSATYEYHGVKHPPSPDPGCRCWETIRERRGVARRAAA